MSLTSGTAAWVKNAVAIKQGIAAKACVQPCQAALLELGWAVKPHLILPPPAARVAEHLKAQVFKDSAAISIHCFSTISAGTPYVAII